MVGEPVHNIPCNACGGLAVRIVGPARPQTGYSLLELTLIVAILGIVAVAAMPNIASTRPYKLDLAAEEIAQAMRFSRSEAIRLGSPRGFDQNSNQKRIRVFRPDTGATPWAPVYDVYHPINKRLYDIELDTHPFAAADTVTRSTSFRGTCNQTENVYFDATGAPRCVDPETVLVEQFDVTLTLGSLTRVVTLHSVTGRVTVQ